MERLDLYKTVIEKGVRRDCLEGTVRVDKNRFEMISKYKRDKYGDKVIYCHEYDYFVKSKLITKSVAYMTGKEMALSRMDIFGSKERSFITDEYFCDFNKYFEIYKKDDLKEGIYIRDKQTNWIACYDFFMWNDNINQANKIAEDINKRKQLRAFDGQEKIKDDVIRGQVIRNFILSVDSSTDKEIFVRNIIETVNNENAVLYKASKKYLDSVLTLKGVQVRNIKSQKEIITVFRNELYGKRAYREKNKEYVKAN